MIRDKYPDLRLCSKRALADAIKGGGMTFEQSLGLINNCLKNKDSYWRDNEKQSKPDKEKWVRDASRSPLGRLLKTINNKILAPNDHLFPAYIYGGVVSKSNKDAAKALLGSKRRRIMLKMDMRRFYEHITCDDVIELFRCRFHCSKRLAEIVAYLVCVPEGKKSPNNGNKMILGRGFSTSSRIATWCNLDLFVQIFYLMEKYLKKHDPRISIYMDDIGITASRAEPEKMVVLYNEILKLVETNKSNLEINTDKTKIVDYLKRTYSLTNGDLLEGCAPYEFVGVELCRNRLRLGVKARGNMSRLVQKTTWSKHDLQRVKGARRYRRYLEE